MPKTTGSKDIVETPAAADSNRRPSPGRAARRWDEPEFDVEEED